MDPTAACQAVADGQWVAKVHAFQAGFSEGTLERETLQERAAELMGAIQRNIKGNGDQESCTAVASILESSMAISSQVARDRPGQVLAATAYHVLNGGCFYALPPEHYFLEYVFQRYGNDTHNLTLAGLAKLMQQLKAGSEASHAEHDHAHDSHTHDGHQDHAHEGAAHDHHDDDSSHKEHLDHEHGNETRHPHQDDDEMDHHPSSGTHQHNDEMGHYGKQTEKILVRQRRSLPGPDKVPHEVWDTVCLSPSDLLEIYGIDARSGISHPDFTRLSPALIQQQLSKACSIPRTAMASERLTTAEKYIYGSLATLVICLCALFGIVLLLCTACISAYQYVIQVFVSLAVGSLTGDAMLHLIPKFLGLHSHSNGEEHDHGEAEGQDTLWKLLAVLGGLYLFFLLEKFFILLGHSDYEEDSGSSKGHQCDHGMSLQLYQDEMKRRKQEKGASHADLVAAEEADFNQLRKKEPSRELRMLPYMITIGDAIHNFADGLAIGAAFSASWKTGLATSLAVLCHELPHELGDFAALLHAGLSVRRALLLNFVSALTAFIGLYIALSVATGEEFEAWIFTVATGLFLYVALCDMLPALMNVKDKRPWLLFGLQNLGLLAGWAILLLLSLFEENITL
ncbi:zinc transporter ZIP4 [Tiliqua scincoides]|uniref:zinc transporter ZIP4 n=1 Tax=Tiliqua scincoides TaxID=71010 RepID=UPI003463279F